MNKRGFNFKALGRLPAGQMNRTEKSYAAHLDLLKYGGDILWWKFEPAKLRLAQKTFYTCDFMVLMKDNRIEMHEVKGGFITDDAAVKIKVAASLYPFDFFIIRKKGAFWMKTPVPPTERGAA
jgi:hypothetical protein